MTDEMAEKWLARMQARNRSIAAGLTIFFVVVVVVIPLWLFGSSVIRQGYSATVSAQHWAVAEFPGKLRNFIKRNHLQERYEKGNDFLQRLKRGDVFAGKKRQTVNAPPLPEECTAEGGEKINATETAVNGISQPQAETPALDQNVETLSADTVASVAEKGALPNADGTLDKVENEDIGVNLAVVASEIIGSLKDALLLILKRVGLLIFNFCIMLFVMYQVLADRGNMWNYIKSRLPLSEDAQAKVGTRIRDVSRAVFLGIFGTSITQGLCAMLLFKLVGIPMFWGIMLGICSIVPVVGTCLVWVPIVGYFCLAGHYWSALFILVTCGCIVANLDMVIRPLLMKKSGETGMSYMVLFLSILGGMQTFGLVGLVYGPMITGLCSICLLIFSTQFKEGKTEKANKLDKKG